MQLGVLVLAGPRTCVLRKCGEDSCINDTGADCKSDTCRLSSACGWTVCGKQTNYMPAGIGDADVFLGGGRKPVPGGAGGDLGGAGTWPEKKKRELWSEPESAGGGLGSAEVLAAVLGRKKQLEHEVDPGASLASGREDLLDQLVEAVSERLRRRG